MPLVSTKANAGSFGLGWSAVLPGEELGGMVLLAPSSISVTGSGSESATINTNGSVSYANTDTLTINGIFSSSYDNYLIVGSQLSSSTGTRMECRLTVAGVSQGGGTTDYTSQFLNADATTVSGGRSSSSYGRFFNVIQNYPSGDTVQMYGPYLAQPTAWRTVDIYGDAFGRRIIDSAVTYSQSTQCDGLYLNTVTGVATGTICIYGLVGA